MDLSSGLDSALIPDFPFGFPLLLAPFLIFFPDNLAVIKNHLVIRHSIKCSNFILGMALVNAGHFVVVGSGGFGFVCCISVDDHAYKYGNV